MIQFWCILRTLANDFSGKAEGQQRDPLTEIGTIGIFLFILTGKPPSLHEQLREPFQQQRLPPKLLHQLESRTLERLREALWGVLWFFWLSQRASSSAFESARTIPLNMLLPTLRPLLMNRLQLTYRRLRSFQPIQWHLRTSIKTRLEHR